MGLEKIEIITNDERAAAIFRGHFLYPAAWYFPKLEQWCPPIYLGINPAPSDYPGRNKTHISANASYLYIPQVDVIPGDNDLLQQMANLYHELAHVFEVKILGRTANITTDEVFAWAIQNAVERGDRLIYVLLSHMMEGRL